MNRHVIGVYKGMLDINDFAKKQIVFFSPSQGDKMSYRNDNLIITSKDGTVKYQHTCYRIFMVIVVGDCSITTGLLRRAHKFGFAICFMSYGFRLYSTINAGMEGNTLLHEKQYAFEGTELGQMIIANKIHNQMAILQKIRNKTEDLKETISLIRSYELKMYQVNNSHMAQPSLS